MWKTLLILLMVLSVQISFSSEPIPPPPSAPTPPGVSIDGAFFLLFLSAIIIGYFFSKKFIISKKGSL